MSEKKSKSPKALSPIPADVQALSFEVALAELEGIVRSLEGGQAKLEEAVSAYERGVLLKRHCAEVLSHAKMRLEQVTETAEGTLDVAPIA